MFKSCIAPWRTGLHRPEVFARFVELHRQAQSEDANLLLEIIRLLAVAVVLKKGEDYVLLPIPTEDIGKAEKVLGTHPSLIPFSQAMLGFVSGAVEEGENTNSAVLREIKEETQMVVKLEELKARDAISLVVEQMRDNKHYRFFVKVFVLNLTDEQFTHLCEKCGARVVVKEDILANNLSLRPLAQALFKFLE